MMEKSALASEGGNGESTPPPFTLFTITYKVAGYTSAEREDTPPISSLPYMYFVEASSRLTEKKKIALIEERRGQCCACCESQREGRGAICQSAGRFSSLVLLGSG
jgi:hypothetical protein